MSSYKTTSLTLPFLISDVKKPITSNIAYLCVLRLFFVCPRKDFTMQPLLAWNSLSRLGWLYEIHRDLPAVISRVLVPKVCATMSGMFELL